MAQTLVNIGTPYEGGYTFISATAIPANTVVFGPVTRSTLLLSAQVYFGSASSQSASIDLLHDPTGGPAGTGSIICSATLISAGGTFNSSLPLVGSLQLNPGDWVTLGCIGSAVAVGQLKVTIQAVPN